MDMLKTLQAAALDTTWQPRDSQIYEEHSLKTKPTELNNLYSPVLL